MQNHYTINITANQVNLSFSVPSSDVIDMSTAHIKQLLREKYEPKKKDNLHLADAYQLAQMDNGPAKAVRLATCARWLEFAISPDASDKRYKITKTSSCHVRLCPVCQWRRSLNTYRNLAQVYSSPALKKYKHMFVTLTQRNVPLSELSAEVKRISDAYASMMRRQPCKGIVKGYTRTIEVTIGKDGLCHPHIHAIWSVAKSYGHKEYIRQKDLCNLWADALGLDYIPICDMRMVSTMDGRTVAEVAKYSVKPADYISDRLEKTADIIKFLDPALDGKRFVSYGGVVRDVKKELFSTSNIEDIEAETVPQAEWENWERLIYEWHFSSGSYRQINGCAESNGAGAKAPLNEMGK